MSCTEILLSKMSYKVKVQSANEIINNHNLPLNTDQILLAHKRITIFIKNNDVSKNNRVFFLEKIFNINTEIYIAIILALCDDFHPQRLLSLMILDNNTQRFIDVGDSYYCVPTFRELLDYYDFDINNFPNISDEKKSKIEEYRQTKYSGKLTKSATKNEKYFFTFV